VTDLPSLLAGRRVAIVHDWLTGMRGGEKVLESICRLAPSAELVTLVHIRGSVSPLIEQRRIRTSIVQRLPDPARWYRHYLPVFPTAIELFDFDHVDLVISTSHCAAKAVVPTGRARHICYCHTPMRYVWDQFDAYFGPQRLGAAGSRAARHVARWLADWDRRTSPRVHRFVANSAHVAGRIARYYNRPASVVHAPVATEFFTPSSDDASPSRPGRDDQADLPRRSAQREGGRFLVVSALVPYKRVDVAIQAAMSIGARLTIIGTGPDEARLRKMSGSGIEFAGAVSDVALRDAYRSADALVLPAEEDFGIAPVEAQACGTPVVALGRGGARETVEPGVTGLLVDTAEAGAFAAAMSEIPTLRVDPAVLRAHAERFSTVRFEDAFSDIVRDTLMSEANGQAL
jgi:glycosyltransferase involved in cell wall biosynthesis